MFVEEHLDLVFIDVAHLLGRHHNLIAVLVSALGRQHVHLADFGKATVVHANGGQVAGRHLTARVMRQTLVALLCKIMPCQDLSLVAIADLCMDGAYWHVIVQVCFHFELLFVLLGSERGDSGTFAFERERQMTNI